MIKKKQEQIIINSSKRKPQKIKIKSQESTLEMLSAKKFIKKLKTHQSQDELKKYHRYFTFDEKDKSVEHFIGVQMGKVFNLAKEFIEMPLEEIEKLLESPVHEIRAGAVSIMDYQARSKKFSAERKKELFELYLRRHDRINNWDLVDRSAQYVIGAYLFDKSHDILFKLARSENVWERRTAIVSTAYFIRNNNLETTFRIAEILLKDKEEPVQKATGWMLRFAGDKNLNLLINFLEKYAREMPAIVLSNSIEKLDKRIKDYFKHKNKSN